MSLISWEWGDDGALRGFTTNNIGIQVTFDECRSTTWIQFTELDALRSHENARIARIQMDLYIGSEAEEKIIKSVCEQIVEEYNRFDKEEGRA